MGPGSREQRRRIAVAERRVCAIEIDGGAPGTGFLIGRSHVLTNHHVVRSCIGSDSFGGIRCRFDYRGPDETGIRIPVNDILDLRSPECAADADAAATAGFAGSLDYAILELAQDVAGDPGPEGERGCFRLFSDQAPPDDGADILLLQHPREASGRLAQRPLTTSYGKIVKQLDGGLRVQHSAETFMGSSGSPVIALETFQIVALHNSGDREQRRAVPISRIVRHMRNERPALAEKLLRQPEGAVPSETDLIAAQARRDGVERRRKAALLLMDRHIEENQLLSLVAPIVLPGRPARPAPVFHVIYSREEADRFGWFEQRLRLLSLAVPRQDRLKSRVEALRGERGAGWGNLPLTWPPFDRPAEERRDAVIAALDEHPRDGSYLASASLRLGPRFDAAAERQLVADAARSAVEDLGLGPDRLQVIINYYVPGNAAEPALEAFEPLWKRDDPPSHCGFCDRFSDVGFDQLSAWMDYLETAWGPSPPAFLAAARQAFESLDRLPLDRIGRALEPALSDYIATALSRPPEGN